MMIIASQRSNDDHNFVAPGSSLHRGFGRIIDTIARGDNKKKIAVFFLALCEFLENLSRYWRLSSCRLCDSVKPIFTDKAETADRIFFIFFI